MAPGFFKTLLVSSLALLASAAPQIGRRARSDTSTDATLGLGVPIRNFNAKDIVPNRYIVVYNNTYDDDAIDLNMNSIKSMVAKRNLNKRGLAGNLLSTSIKSYKMNKWRAMVLESDETMIMDILNTDEVEYIEADIYVKVVDYQSQNLATTGLARLSHARAGSESNYVFDESAGKGITVYVVDTGVLTTHDEFEGRAEFSANFNSDGIDEDLNGHGSHVAGTIAGKTFGVAKKATIKAVKVLGADGGGTASAVIDGIQFVGDDMTANKLKGKAIMNMSLGGGASTALDQAVSNLAEMGVVPVVAAGNDGIDADNSSPARVKAAITVGAMDQLDDSRASFSNFGPLVDIYAPGVDVESVGIADDRGKPSNTASRVLSGTSMACPHVAGLAAYLMAFEGLSTLQQVDSRIKELAEQTGAQVQNNARDTTDLIANNGVLN